MAVYQQLRYEREAYAFLFNKVSNMPVVKLGGVLLHCQSSVRRILRLSSEH